MKELKGNLLELFKKEKLDNFMPRLDKFHTKVNQLISARDKEEELRKGLSDDLTALKKFVKNPPIDAKKILKPKNQVCRNIFCFEVTLTMPGEG